MSATASSAAKKTIAIVTPVFPPQRGGIGRVAETDAAQLAALGYDVTVYAPRAVSSDASGGKTVGGYALRRLPSWFRYGYAAFAPAAVRLLRGHDVVLLHFPFFGAAEPIALARALGASGRAKLIVSYHMDVTGAAWLTRFFSAPTRLLTPSILGTADRVLVTSFDYARSSRAAAVFAAQPHRFRELPPGVDTDRLAPGPKSPELLAKYGLPADVPVIVFLGGLDAAHYFKGVPTLLAALSSEVLSQARLLVIGDGNLRASYEEMADGMEVADRVTFAGAVPDADLAAHLRLGDVFAFPSTDGSEAFGIAALEAMSCGLPAVASDLAGVRTIVRDGVTGETVPPGSASALALALARLLSNPALRAELGIAARRMAIDEYALPVRAARWQAILRDLGV